MQFVIAFLALAVLSTAFTAPALSKSYWLLARNDDHTWCGYSNPAEFKSDAAKLRPGESARVTYSSGKLTEITYQVEPDSADWIVIDKYTESGNELRLRRANLLAQQNLEIIEETTISDGKGKPFSLVRVTTLDGRKAQAPPKLDLPSVPVRTTLSSMPFIEVLSEMRSRSMAKLCKQLQ